MSDADLSSAQTESALLLFSFGPVQPFIAAARKTADLWTGSTLLSRLAREALRPVRDECGDEAVIFPALPAGDAEAAVSYPNRFVAAVPDARADALAASAHEALQSALSDLVSGALDRAHITNETARALADRQVETFLDVNWSILPLQQGREYGEQYHQLERQLGARKATRSFDGRTAPGYRCDLIPKLAALVPSRDCSPGAVRDYWAQHAERLPASRLRDGEELSAVALAKRLAPDLDDTAVAPDEEAFPSTSSLATADFKAAVLHAAPEHDDLRSAVDDYVEAMEALTGPLGAREAPLPALEAEVREAETREAEARESGLGAFARLSGEWLFPSSFDPDRLGRQDTPVPPTDRAEALQALQALHAAAGKVGIGPPSRYYALLLLDGDNMGAWLSGETAPPGVSVDRAYHRSVSRALGRFAQTKVPRGVEESHRGRVVYSGGDDVMAFVSLRHALPAARALRAAFSGQLGDDGHPDWDAGPSFTQDPEAPSPTLGETATASAGLVVAHHMQPLDQVLEQAHRAEQAAKDQLGRDALACAVLKRSGDRLQAGGPWYRNGTDLVGAMQTFGTLVRDGTVSKGLLHTLQSEAASLATLAQTAPEAARAEMRRVFARQSSTDTPAADFDRTVGALLEQTSGQAAPLDAATDLLSIAQFIGMDGAP